MHFVDLARCMPTRLRVTPAPWMLLVLPLVGWSGASSAAFSDQPEAVRPGAVRPAGDAPTTVAAGADATPDLAVDLPLRPGAVRPADLLAPRVDASSLALGVADLPDAVRPGAIRPGEAPRAVPKAPPEELFKVPAVADRPLVIDEGDKIKVARFVVEGAVDRPEHKIEVKDVQALVDAKLSTHADGFTVGRLQEVADEVTKFYRDHGLILAQAFVPVQAVDSGTVKIQVMEGLLGRVVTEGNKMYKASVLERPFGDLIGQPVTKSGMESALLSVATNPGQSSFGVFQPGQRVGTAEMVLKVQDEKRVEASARWDNHGITETGLNRELGKLTFNNPAGYGDRFDVTYQRTVAPANTQFYAFRYEIPLPYFNDTKIALGYDRNAFDVAGKFRSQQIHSDIRNYDFELSRALVRGRLFNLNAVSHLTKKTSETKSLGTKTNIDRLTLASFGLNFDAVDARFGGLNTGSLVVTHGFNDLFGAMGSTQSRVKPSRTSDSGKFAEGDFNKAELTFTRYQALSPLWDKLKDHNLLFTTEVMWSPDLLVALEQYSVGGPDNVRGYRPTEKLFDRAIFGSVEWIINAPFIADKPAFGNRTWGELLQFSWFYDVATGYLNATLGNERRAENLNSAGFAISFNNPKVFSTKLSIATPLGRPKPQNDRFTQYWLDLNFFF